MTGPYRALTVDLGPGPAATDVVRRAHRRPGLVALLGAWADGGAVLTSHPIGFAESPTGPDGGLGVEAAPGFLGGGWFGRLPYDGSPRLAWHDHVLRHVAGRWRFEALATDERAGELAARLAEWRALLAGSTPDLSWTVEAVTAPAATAHLAAVEQAIELVRAGELYQVNVCTRLAGRFTGSPAGLFAAAVDRLAPAYAAYVAGDGDQPALVSLSPELFLRRRGRTVTSEPIKGTVPRDAPDGARALRRSSKDVAENVMIVDLVRNDLGRVSEVGTVRPRGLLEVRPAPGVWHLVSSVEARLRDGAGDADLLAATFPPGSVTGAPKERARAAIAALEPAARGTFTGAIGYAGTPFGLELNVAIRTFEIAGGAIELGVGGGITADSVPMLEWRECGHKAAPLLQAAGAGLPSGWDEPPPAGRSSAGVFETLLAVDGRPVRLADHLARLDRSVRELYGDELAMGLGGELAGRVRAAAATVPAGRCAVRVLVRPPGEVSVSATATGDPTGPVALHCTPRPAGLWRHKWADRSWTAPGALYVDAGDDVLETERGNVFVIAADGTLVTPPLRDDLLPGVTRRAVLDLARDEGRRTELRDVPLAELRAHAAFWTSSLSGAVPIPAVDGRPLPRADGVIAEFAAALLGGEKPFR